MAYAVQLGHDRLMKRFIAVALLLFGAVVASADEAAVVQSVYARTGQQFLWSSHAQPSRQALALIDLLRAVDSYGLEPGDYGMDLINTRAGQWNALAEIR